MLLNARQQGFRKDPSLCFFFFFFFFFLTEWAQYRALDLDSSQRANSPIPWWSICAMSIAPRTWRRMASFTKASAGEPA